MVPGAARAVNTPVELRQLPECWRLASSRVSKLAEARKAGGSTATS
jgi:hypothetical protein